MIQGTLLPNKRLQRTGISVSLIENLSHDAVVARQLKAIVRRLDWLIYGGA